MTPALTRGGLTFACVWDAYVNVGMSAPTVERGAALDGWRSHGGIPALGMRGVR